MATLEDVQQSLAMLEAGMVKPVISASVKFSEAREGPCHARSARRRRARGDARLVSWLVIARLAQ